MTPELFMQWKKKKMAERDAGLAAQMAERAKNDRMRCVLFPMFSNVCSHRPVTNFLDIVY